ncbi:DUF1398 family protein [Paenibacillus koleovorans]|uniref:DUF1398 family protein n=1 Tax=Paenibacillus koleovorans TaxID=121608 RepID=UPI000FDBC3AF|nr:DUF1398 family protein [Paenibacillus koleovorans]
MMNVEQVKQISENSKREKWPYPRTFQAFREAGVVSYRNMLADHTTVFFGGDGTSYEEMAPEGAGPGLAVADMYDGEAVRRDLAHHQQHRTPYVEFVQDMARAGVRYYEVNMERRVVIYTSGRAGESYTEDVPVPVE